MNPFGLSECLGTDKCFWAQEQYQHMRIRLLHVKWNIYIYLGVNVDSISVGKIGSSIGTNEWQTNWWIPNVQHAFECRVDFLNDEFLVCIQTACNDKSWENQHSSEKKNIHISTLMCGVGRHSDEDRHHF